MKKIFTLIIFLPTFCFAQKETTIPSPFKYEVIDTATNLSAAQIFSKAKIFIAEKFKSSKYMTQLDDVPSNTLIVQNANFPVTIQGAGANISGKPQGWGDVIFTIKIQAKDGKCKITLSDFYHTTKYNQIGMPEGGRLGGEKGGFMMTKKQWKKINEDVAESSIAFLESFKKSINSSDDF